MSKELVPSAQYLRMSTEHQQYSLENQCRRDSKYAETHGFHVLQTYTDAARSGVTPSYWHSKVSQREDRTFNR